MANNETTTSPHLGSKPASKPRSWRRIFRRVFWLGLMFAVGAVAGSAGTIVTISQMRSKLLNEPEQMADRFTELVRCDAGLNDQETEVIRVIVDRHHAKMLAMHREFYPQVQAELNSLESDICAVLTPQQHERWLPRFRMFRKFVAP